MLFLYSDAIASWNAFFSEIGKALAVGVPHFNGVRIRRGLPGQRGMGLRGLEAAAEAWKGG